MYRVVADGTLFRQERQASADSTSIAVSRSRIILWKPVRRIEEPRDAIPRGQSKARIRLSDKTSRLRPRHIVPKPAQAHEPEVPVRCESG